MTNDTGILGTVPRTPAADPVFQRIGLITRQLHDALEELGVMPKLQHAAHGLPDARSRLNYVANKSADAANKVLTLVDQAKVEHRCIADGMHRIASILAGTPALAGEAGALTSLVRMVDESRVRSDAHLTDIMLAQDFHDLTGQVVSKVVLLAGDLEDSLVKLLVQVAPPDQIQKADAANLEGPVVDPHGREDVVANQGEVDDLLASLGF